MANEKVIYFFGNAFPLNIRNEDAAANIGVPALDDHNAQSSRALQKKSAQISTKQSINVSNFRFENGFVLFVCFLDLFESDDAQVFETRVALLGRLLFQADGEPRDGRDGHFLQGSFPAQDDDGDASAADGLDDGRGVQVTPSVQNVAVDLDQLVADLQTAVFEGDAARIEAANEDGHDGTILVSGQAQAEAGRRQCASAGRRTIQIDSNYFALQVPPSFMDFFYSKQETRNGQKRG